MKRLYLILLFVAVTLSGMAQNIGETFYIYRNDGYFNAFFRDEVISIDYSYEDADGNIYDEIVTQIVNTADSVYKIPLAAIDSIGFVQPETKYKEGTIPLTGSLFDHLVSAEGLTLKFNTSLPLSLIPQVGDKLVSTDVTSKLPCGFVGQVRQVSSNSDGIKVQCDSIGLGDAVSRFYGVYDIAVGGSGGMRVRGLHKSQHVTTYPYDLPFGRTQLPPIDISAFVTKKNIFDINYKNTIDIAFTPSIHIKVTRVIDDNILLSYKNHTNWLVITDADVEMGFDVCGEASKEWKKSFLPKQDYIIPPGIPLYFDMGVKVYLNGEIATAFTTNSHVHQVIDITNFDVSLLPVIGDFIGRLVNRIDGTMDITTCDMNWDYLGFRAELKPCVYLRVGLPAISHVAGWVGGEFDGGVNMNGELMFDYRQLQNAEQGTAVYDELKDHAKIDIKPYAGAHFMAAVLDDHYSFRLGNDFENPRWTWFQGRILPGFSNTNATRLSETKVRVTANVTNVCFIPYTLGFALYDEDNNHVQTKLYGEKYWTHNDFSSYSCDFDGLNKTKKYKVYPIIRFYGKYDMLASPSAEILAEEKACPNANHPHWIDLGLPSGTQWRCCNEGASTPEGYGGYYPFRKVASIPSLNQIKELCNNATYVRTKQNGVHGFKFTGPNGGTIFLPAAGFVSWYGDLLGVGSRGGYWSSTSHDEDYAWGLYFYDMEAGWNLGWNLNNSGDSLSVRPVR